MLNTMIVVMLLFAVFCVLIAFSVSWLVSKIMYIVYAFINIFFVIVVSGIVFVFGTFYI